MTPRSRFVLAVGVLLLSIIPAPVCAQADDCRAGIIETVAGDGWTDEDGAGRYRGDGGPATEASLNEPVGVAVAADGRIYIADQSNDCVRGVDPAGVIATVAGSGREACLRDGGPATEASLYWASHVAVAPDGSIYIADPRNDRVAKVDRLGVIITVAGTCTAGYSKRGYSGDGGPATQALLDRPKGVAVGAEGSIYIADADNGRIRKVDPAGIITTVAGSEAGGFSGDGGLATDASLSSPEAVTAGADGSLYIADTENHRVRKVDPAGVITTVAGSGEEGDAGDGGPATQALLNLPTGVALDADGSLYIADSENGRVRRLNRAGIIETVAGRGRGRRCADDGPATEASLNSPYSVALAHDGSLYIADFGNYRVRKVDPAGIITTVAGQGPDFPPRVHPFSGDGGPATRARLCGPTGVAVGADGSLYIADSYNHRIRRVDPGGTITTVAGDGWEDESRSGCFSGDGGVATQASLNRPTGVALGPDGSLYIADSGNHRIRRVRWFPCEPEAAKAAANGLRAKGGDSPLAWREAAELYLIAQSWDEALAAAERLVALMPEADEPARTGAEVLAARAYAGKRDDHEARRRLVAILARASDPIVLREASEALVNLYLLRDERQQAIATLNDLRLRTQDRGLRNWIDQRLKAIAGD